jgi:transcriptional regulator with XRE-family HTH domain
MNFKSHRQYVQEQIEKNPEFAAEYAKAQMETRFAIALAMLREKQGMTQQQLAEAAGLSQPMLARYENGQIPTVPTLQRLAAALGARVLLLPDEITFESLSKRRNGAHRVRSANGKARSRSTEAVPA